jgi:hypothetical protein
MTDINDFLKSEREAYKTDPEKYERERREDARREYKDVDRYQNEKLMERAERMAKSKEARTSGGGGKAAGSGSTSTSTSSISSRHARDCKAPLHHCCCHAAACKTGIGPQAGYQMP